MQILIRNGWKHEYTNSGFGRIQDSWIRMRHFHVLSYYESESALIYLVEFGRIQNRIQLKKSTTIQLKSVHVQYWLLLVGIDKEDWWTLVLILNFKTLIN